MQVARETADAPRRPEHVAEKRGDVDIKGMMTTTNYHYHAAVVMGRAFRGPRRRGLTVVPVVPPPATSSLRVSRLAYGTAAARRSSKLIEGRQVSH